MLNPRMLAATILALSLGQPTAPSLPPAPGSPDFLEWRAPAACPDAETVKASIAQLAGRSPTPQEVSVRAIASQGVDEWQLDLRTRAGMTEQQQVLRAQSCQGLADATALIVAVLLDPVSAAGRITVVEPPTDRGLTPAPAPAPALAESTTQADSTSEPRRAWTFGLGLGVGGERGAIPRVTGGARLTLFARRGRFEARVSGSYWIPRTTPGPGAGVQLGTVGAAACFVPAVGALQIPVCAGLEGGGLRARGHDVPNETTEVFPWVAGTVGPSLRWWVRPRFGLFAAAEAFVPVISTQVTLASEDGERPVHEPAPAGLRAFLGISLRFSRSL